jgi:hypothetical protein
LPQVVGAAVEFDQPTDWLNPVGTYKHAVFNSAAIPADGGGVVQFDDGVKCLAEEALSTEAARKMSLDEERYFTNLAEAVSTPGTVPT